MKRKLLLILSCALMITGCSTGYYRNKADKEVYDILSSKELRLFGSTNGFSVDTKYSHRDPLDIPAEELIEGRKLDGTNVTLNLVQALDLAVANNRSYQTRKEKLYLTALTLTLRRHDFAKKPLGQLAGGLVRESDTDLKGKIGDNEFGFKQAFQTGGAISLNLANDMVRFFTGDPRRSITTVISANLTQPILRGSSADVVAENLTQAERNVIYAIRDFALFQQTFSVEIVTDYFRLLQGQDEVRNSYNNYVRLVKTVEQAEAFYAAERMKLFQVDQAKQQRLSGRSSYIRAVQKYQAELDEFKKELEIPVGVHLNIDASSLEELQEIGLQLVRLPDRLGYEMAITNKFDIINEIDRFEDSKRKIKVAADALRANLTLLAGASLENDATDYANFDPGNYKASVGLELDLPFDRKSERNTYRARLIEFERQLRSLTLTLDDAREAVREDLRELEQLRQNHEIQTAALVLANKRVEVTPELFRAGKAQIRDLLEAQDAQLSAQNAVTAVLVDYLAARLKFLVDIGVLNRDEDQWWLKNGQLLGTDPSPSAPDAEADIDGILTPEQVFEGRLAQETK